MSSMNNTVAMGQPAMPQKKVVPVVLPSKRSAPPESKYKDVPWFIDPFFKPKGFGQKPATKLAQVVENDCHPIPNTSLLVVVDLWGPVRIRSEVDGTAVEFQDLDQARSFAVSLGYEGVQVRFQNELPK